MKLVITGVVKNTSTWMVVAQVEAEETATLEQLNEGAEQIRDLIAQAFKSGKDGYMTLGDVVINMQSFAVLSVSVKE
jgi:hypothetical protein